MAAAMLLLAVWWNAGPALFVAAGVYLSFRLLVAWHAARSERRRANPRPGGVGRWVLYVALFGLSFLASQQIARLWRNALAQSFRVRGAGMGDTVRAGERVLVNLAAYAVPHPFKGGEWRRFRDPQRGDVICYKARNKKGGSSVWIHRVIGLPGDVMEVRDGRVRINNRELDEPYVTVRAREPYGPYKIPQSQYVVLGDDRQRARDSRHPTPGYVFRDDILGKAACVWWGRVGKRLR